MSGFLQAQDGDFSYDKDSKSIIPKYLGKVILLKGTAKALGKGAPRALNKGDKIYPDESIQTSEKSFAKVEMVDTSVVTAGPDTTLAFEGWKYKTKSDREVTLNLIKGKLRSHFKVKANKEDSLKIKVGHVAMGVRGTRILANHYTRDDKVTVSHVATLSGKTNVYDKKADMEKKQKAGDQYISFLKPDGSILKVKATPLSQKELQYLKSDDKNPLKYFRPFMKEFQGKNIDQELGRTDSQIQGNGNLKKNRGQKGGSWKDTLKKLNKRLNEED